MASRATPGELQEEATCSLCLGYLTEPVTIACGHNFCQACLTRNCEERGAGGLTCPQCRAPFQKGQFKPNSQLNNILQKLRQLGPGQGEGLCKRHQKRLKLFYEDYGATVCLVCEKSRDHKSHRLVPMEEAAQEDQEQFEAHVKMLREEKEKLREWKAMGEEKSQEYLKQTRAEWQKIVAEFQQQRHFLEEQERLLLAQLQNLDEELVTHQTERGRKLSEQISRLSKLIGELEGKCQKPASEFLQDIRSTLSRCEKGQAQQPEEMAPELEERVRGFSQKVIVLSKMLREFKDTLPDALGTPRWEPLRAHRPDPFFPKANPWNVALGVTLVVLLSSFSLNLFKLKENQEAELTNVTLDPDTAHPQLVLSEDRKRVRRADTEQPWPDTPERFDSVLCVLGHEGFTSGRHCWEVEVGGGRYWAVGVARESVSRKGGIRLKGKIWAVQQKGDEFRALTDPATPLSLSPLSRIRVCLDCDWGQVTFIDPGAKSLIFIFPPGSLPGERIQPWFWVRDTDTELRLSP